jgi:hypothetical protein
LPPGYVTGYEIIKVFAHDFPIRSKPALLLWNFRPQNRKSSRTIVNDPKNRYAVDAPDIQQLLRLHGSRLDIALVREYFRLFEKEDLLDEWLGEID